MARKGLWLVGKLRFELAVGKVRRVESESDSESESESVIIVVVVIIG